MKRYEQRRDIREFSVQIKKKKKSVWYHSLNNVFQHSKSKKNVFSTCVYFCKKSWSYVRKKFYLIWTENSLYPFVAHISSSLPYIPSIPSAENQTPTLQNLHQHLRTSMVELHGRRISSPSSAFKDPARDRAFVAANPSLQDSGSNLTFTFFVNGFWSKEWRVPQTEKFVFWFLFFVFVFRPQSGKPIFSVLCLLLRWSFDLQSKHRRPTF